MLHDTRRVVTETTTPLAASGVFSGPWIDCLRYNRVAALYSTDSATTVLWVQHATSATPVSSVIDALAAAVDGAIEAPLKGRYVRIVVQAGATAQTRLSATLILS